MKEIKRRPAVPLKVIQKTKENFEGLKKKFFDIENKTLNDEKKVEFLNNFLKMIDSTENKKKQ